MPEETPRAMSAWQTDRDPLNVAVMGKLLEELGEAVAATSRCLIHGVEENEPTTGKPNRQWLEEEIADVEALIMLAKARLHLQDMPDRRSRKLAEKLEWLMLIKVF